MRFEWDPNKSEKSTKMAEQDALRPEYRREDLGTGVRGKYHRADQEGKNLILLSPDVAAAFPTDEAVNEALRALIDVAKRSVASTTGDKGPQAR